MKEWQPIETAPKDGRSVLLWMPGGDGTDDERRCDIGCWGVPDWSHYEMWLMNMGDGWFAPTHWMPLPPPPEQNKP